MNGTIYEEIKKNGNSKKKEKLKFAIMIISTNILAAVCGFTLAPTYSAPPIIKSSTKTLHAHYKMIVVPLTVLIDIDQSSIEIPVTLVNKSKKVLISKAYLHEMLTPKSQALEGPQRFKIEIPEGELLQLSTDGEETMLAIPELKIPVKNKNPIHRRVSQYEINL